jgi:hypothetical protein
MDFIVVLSWALGIILIVAVLDIARLGIQRLIWNRRHARMVEEVKRRHDENWGRRAAEGGRDAIGP